MDWKTYITDLDIPKDWMHTSYHNDELPSYQVNGLHIWIDSHDPKLRIANANNIIGLDNGFMPRFTCKPLIAITVVMMITHGYLRLIVLISYLNL